MPATVKQKPRDDANQNGVGKKVRQQSSLGGRGHCGESRWSGLLAGVLRLDGLGGLVDFGPDLLALGIVDIDEVARGTEAFAGN